jgi:D-3-phosphoglycerate dehydrogenase
LRTNPLNVVITDCTWDDNSVERDILEKGGAKVTRAQCISPSDVIAACENADALLVGWATINQEVISRLHHCRLLMRYGTGYNNIDAEAAAAAGIAVAINTDYCLEEVASHALAMVLACSRQLSVLQNQVRNGGWNPAAVLLPAPPLSQQTMGILGFGRIGRRLAELVRPLVKEILVHDPLISEGSIEKLLVKLVAFDQLLAESDYLSIHSPLNVQTERMFNSTTLSKMKKGAYLINCARGPIVDETALIDAVRNGHLGGAGLDVFSQEPLPPDHPLRNMPRVITTPHAAWYSTQADYLLRAIPAQNVLRFFAGETIQLVNRPIVRKDVDSEEHPERM